MNGFELLKKTNAKNAIGIKINDEIHDLVAPISNNIPAEKIILIEKNSDEGIDIIRYSSALLLAIAIKKLFPSALLAFGKSTENGFYYDVKSAQKISENDFSSIEKEMQQLINKDIKFIKQTITKNPFI
jgi:threonyl-tRNA synthetase